MQVDLVSACFYLLFDLCEYCVPLSKFTVLPSDFGQFIQFLPRTVSFDFVDEITDIFLRFFPNFSMICIPTQCSVSTEPAAVCFMVS